MNPKTVSIHQPNYLPWGGFFNKISSCDIFVIFDDVQFPRGKKNNFAYRNRIKTQGGAKWLTIPINEKNEFKLINEISINNSIPWYEQHWRMIESNYHKTEFFHECSSDFKEIYESKWNNLIELNITIIKKILQILKITTKIEFSSKCSKNVQGVDKIIKIIKNNNGTQYLTGTGPGSIRYIQGFEQKYEENGIKLVEHKFQSPKYKQLFDEFIPNLSIIDMLFNIGIDSTKSVITKNEL